MAALALDVGQLGDLRELGDHVFPVARRQLLRQSPARFARQIVEPTVDRLGPVVEAGHVAAHAVRAIVIAHLAVDRAAEHAGVRRGGPVFSLVRVADAARRELRLQPVHRAHADIGRGRNHPGRLAAVAVGIGGRQGQLVLPLDIGHEDRDRAFDQLG